MSPVAAILALGFLLAAGLAWKCFELIRAAAPDDDQPVDRDAPIDYRKFRQ